MSDPWHVLDSGAGDPAANMALDEALLEAAAATGRPVLRFYGWTGPAATFGYFQHHAEIAALTPLRPLVRRPTGGGLVPHANDWTYSIAVPPGHAWYALRAVDSYERVHDWLRRALERCRVATRLAPCCDPAGPGQCFVGAEKFDLLAGERKIAGAAQRRNKLGLLIQGSVQPPPPGVARPDWQAAMLEVARAEWNVEWQPLEPSAVLRDRVDALVREKYGQPAYNERR